MEDTFLDAHPASAERDDQESAQATPGRSPMYLAIFSDLKRQIENGSLSAGDLVPGEQELCDLYNVSRVTTRRALNELAASGLVVRQRGRGTQVLSAARSLPYRADIDDLINSVRHLGRTTTVKTLEYTRVAAGADAARALRLSPREKVRRCVRLRSLGKANMAQFTFIMPMDVSDRLPNLEHDPQPVLLALLEQQLDVTSANQVVTACAATEDQARWLQVLPGSALIEARRVIYGAQDRPILFVQANFRPQFFQFEMNATAP